MLCRRPVHISEREQRCIRHRDRVGSTPRLKIQAARASPSDKQWRVHCLWMWRAVGAESLSRK
eukprot:6184209-Pleurochrysis_carterae.AAC.3